MIAVHWETGPAGLTHMRNGSSGGGILLSENTPRHPQDAGGVWLLSRKKTRTRGQNAAPGL